MEKAIVLACGGLNSAVAALVSREQYEVHLLHVAWGHRAAERELTCFDLLAAHLRTERKLVVEANWFAQFGGNSRANRKLAMEDMSTLGGHVPSMFALGLMPTMLSIAAAWAGGIGATRVIVGISEDFNVPGPPISQMYPDYRRDFLQTFNLMLEYGKPHGRDLLVEAPLMELTRQEVVHLGRRCKVPFEKTWSCYRNNDEPCGKCLGCTTRTAGFLRASIPDPLQIETAGRHG